jgi:hypothetical protein
MRPTLVFSYQRQGIRPLGDPSPMRLRLMVEKWFGELVWASLDASVQDKIGTNILHMSKKGTRPPP